jgi:filamentous hemagglutinin family protein
MRKKNTNEQLHTQPQFRLKPVYAAVLLAVVVQTAQANPIGGTVAAGQASFATTGNTLNVTNTPGTIINWQGFSIGANEITHFAQQSASSAVLNRVISNNPSSILGTLQSNGRVFLINPGGIVFGAGATVDVAGMVASTLNLSNADFLAGRNHFTQVPGSANLSNAGNITAQNGGQIYLLAPDVENTGVITAPNGEILLAAGYSVDLVSTTNPNLRVNITAPAGDATNVGQLIASSGSLGLFGTVVRNSGTVSADSATMQGGKIVFRASQRTEITGTVTANGTTGGTIQALGNEVQVTAGAVLDASGANGGGTILVGGDAHGANPNVQNAQTTYVDATATIKADATQNGNGGKVVVWSDNATQFNGNISAQGGALSGNGGWVEVSGKQKLGYTGLTNTLAANGLSGTLLLDPDDFFILASGGSMTGAALSFALSLANVIITTAPAGTTVVGASFVPLVGSNLGDIYVSNAVSWTTTNTLTLNSYGIIALNSPITATLGSLILNAGVGGSSTAYIVDVGNLTLASLVANAPAGGTGTTLTGINTLGALDVQSGGGTGTGTLNVSSGTTSLTGTFTANTLNMSGGTLSLNGAAATTLATLNMTGGGTLSNAAALNVGTLNVSGYGGTISGAGALTTPVNSTSTIGVILTAINKTWNNAGTVNFTNGGAIWLAGTSGTFNNQVGGVLNYNGFNTSPVNFGTLNTVNHIFNNAGTLNKNVGSAAAQSIDIIFNNTGTVNVNSGTLTLSNNGTDTGAYNIATGTILNLSGGIRDLNAGAVVTGTGTGNVTVAAGGMLNVAGGTLNSPLVNNGSATFASSSGAYTGAYSGTGALILNPNGWTFSFAPTFAVGYVFPLVTHSNLSELNFDVNATIANLNLSGPFRGTGVITIPSSGILTVYNTILGGVSALTIDQGATANFTQAWILRPMTNLGTMNVTYSSIISKIPSAGPGGSTLPNSGSLTNGATGVLNLNNGDLQPMVGGSFTNAGQVFALTGTNTIDASGGTFSYGLGTITNNGSITVNAGASLAITNGFSSTNSGTYTNGGTLSFSTAISATGQTYTYSGSFINNGTMNFFGAGNAITGTLTQPGLLNVALGVTLAAPGFTNTGTLSGGGTFNLGAGTLTNNGIIAPSGSNALVGTLAITGNLIMGTGSSLNLDINGSAAGQYDVFNVSGTANLTSGTLKLFGVGGAGSYPVLNATGGLGGTTFGTVNSGTLTLTPAYTANNVTLGITANSVAGYIYWTGGAGTSDWATASNWSSLAVPTVADNLYISPAANTVLIAAGAQSGNALVSDANLNLAGGSLALTGSLNLPGTFTVSGGTWNQVAATLPAFNVGNFNLTSGTFIRALGGAGSIANPYQLADIYGVQGIGSAGMLGKSYVLANSINAASTVNWNAGAGFVPVGNINTPFTGQFDGLNHTISNLTINNPNAAYAGLFRVVGVGGIVSNVGLIGSSVIAACSDCGGVAGALAGYNQGTISNSYASNDSVSVGSNVGGLVGQNAGAIINTYASGGTVSGDNLSNGIGGLVGYNTGSIANSYASNSVSVLGIGPARVGGLVGNNAGSVSASFWNTTVAGAGVSFGIGSDAAAAAYGGSDIGATGLTSAGMMTMANFFNAGWDISASGSGTIWRIAEGITMPLLPISPGTVTVPNVTNVPNVTVVDEIVDITNQRPKTPEDVVVADTSNNKGTDLQSLPMCRP